MVETDDEGTNGDLVVDTTAEFGTGYGIGSGSTYIGAGTYRGGGGGGGAQQHKKQQSHAGGGGSFFE